MFMDAVLFGIPSDDDMAHFPMTWMNTARRWEEIYTENSIKLPTVASFILIMVNCVDTDEH